jgi:hypothetical protein
MHLRRPTLTSLPAASPASGRGISYWTFTIGSFSRWREKVPNSAALGSFSRWREKVSKGDEGGAPDSRAFACIFEGPPSPACRQPLPPAGEAFHIGLSLSVPSPAGGRRSRTLPRWFPSPAGGRRSRRGMRVVLLIPEVTHRTSADTICEPNQPGAPPRSNARLRERHDHSSPSALALASAMRFSR